MQPLSIIIGLPLTIAMVVTLLLIHMCITQPSMYLQRLGKGVQNHENGLGIMFYLACHFIGVATFLSGGIILALSWMPENWEVGGGIWLPNSIGLVLGSSLALFAMVVLQSVAERLVRLQQLEIEPNA